MFRSAVTVFLLIFSSCAWSYSLEISSSPDRSAPNALEGSTVSGDIFVFVAPESGIRRVRFFVDGTFQQQENSAPYDLAGTTQNKSNTAIAYDSSQLNDGAHAITAELTLTNGAIETIAATFVVANGSSLVFATTTTTLTAVSGGPPLGVQVALDASDGTSVAFELAASTGASWLSVSSAQSHTPGQVEVTADPDVAGVGTFTGEVIASSIDGSHAPATLEVTFTVLESAAPDQVHLGWMEDAATTMTVVWRTLVPGVLSEAQFREQGASDWITATGSIRQTDGDGTFHQATFVGLSPSTAIEYRLRDNLNEWSQTWTTRTAPLAGSDEFDVIYFADTGLVGRTDGLATGTAQLIDEIAALSPLLTLPGGDYAYFNTDQRFGDLRSTIDAWFDQIAPFATRVPMMPTYGNHETSALQEDTATWVSRFPTPAGHDGRKHYSFDIGNVHFISIFTGNGDTSSLSTNALAWIENDLISASTAGYDWIVAYMHQSSYSDGLNHQENTNLRAQIAPLFEQYGVKIVLTSHDQSYERSFPLVNMPDINTRTSNRISCYGPGDGTVWLKVSPGGKLSNINRGFSPYRSQVPPAWTAVRDNTQHHFARLMFTPDGSVSVESYGFVGDGNPATVIDRFDYVKTACPEELVASPLSVIVTAAAGGTTSKEMSLAMSDGSSANVSLSTDVPWAMVLPSVSSTPFDFLVEIDAASLVKGEYSGNILVTSTAADSATIPIALTVVDPSNYALQVSAQASRASPVLLEGATVSEDIFVFLLPETNVKQVRFYLDDPAQSGSPRQTEKAAPYDFAGTAANNTALAFDTTSISDGVHNITASVSLNDGSVIGLSSDFIVSNSPGGNLPPSASFTYSCSDLTCDFDASDSFDPDGVLAGYTWTFGDGSNGVGQITSHTFTASGSYTVTLSVIDDNSASATTTRTVGVVQGNDAPVAIIGFSCLDLDCTFDGASSHDSDGTIIGYAWNFGDGSAGSGVSTAHSYASAGTYTVSLTVTDNVGSSATSTTTVDVVAGPQPPVAAFSFTCNELTCSFDGSASNDADGIIVSYNWDFGDNQTATGDTTVHTYTQPGTYQVTLTVLDDSTQSGSVTKSASVSSGGGCSQISSLDCNQVRQVGDLTLSFNGTDGGLLSGNGLPMGFTMVDPPSFPGNPLPNGDIPGLWADRLSVASGRLTIQTTAGIQFQANNNQDNALGIGLNVPSRALTMRTTLVDLPSPAPSGYAQAGLWFGRAGSFGRGTSEDDYIKFVVLSPSKGSYAIQAHLEQGGSKSQEKTVGIPSTATTVAFEIVVNPLTRSVQTRYDLGSGMTPFETFSLPDDWFGFDQAGIDPAVATRSFGGIFATHRNASTSQAFRFEEFSVSESVPVTGSGTFGFDKWTIPVSVPTALAWGPDNRLYVTELFGRIHAFTLDPENEVVVDEQIIDAIPNSQGGGRLTLGIDVDPDSTPSNVILWVAHSDGSVDKGQVNSGIISRVSGAGFSVVENVVTGLPRAIANHAINNIQFGPDKRLYISAGGNTGAGAANLSASEFGDRPEQPLSAATLVADVKHPAFSGDCATPIGQFGIPSTCDVIVYASGLRNSYDSAWHSNGKLYATDNGLGVKGTVPPVTMPPCTQLGNTQQDDPGSQPDLLLLITQGSYYGHPNPYRDECVFKDGVFQGAPPLPNYEPPMFVLGNNLSSNAIIEYRGDAFYSKLMGQLLITNFSVGDNVTRVRISDDGETVVESDILMSGFVDPLPLAQDPAGNIYVGELNGNGGRIAVLRPQPLVPAPLGDFVDRKAAPQAILDSGSAALDGKLYMIGGKTASGYVSTVHVYDPVEDMWSLRAPLPGEAVENPAVVEHNGKLYAFGGSTAPFSDAVSNASVYDPATDTWSSLPPMSVGRGGARAVSLAGKIYLIGGLAADGASLSSMEVFDPSLNTWTARAPMVIRRDNPGAAVVNGQLFVFGGRTRDTNGAVVDGTLSSMEIYDSVSNSWMFGPDMPTGRRTMQVGVVSGRIIVMGGESPVTAANEEYDPATNAWRILTPMATPRHGAAAATINGTIHIVGGGPTAGSSFTTKHEQFRY